MKKLYTLFFFFFPLVLSAQHILRSEFHMYRGGDVITKQQVAYKDPGRAGENVLWDFSRLEVEDEAYELDFYTHDDILITGAEHQTHYIYTLQNDSLLLKGLCSPTTHRVNHQPELLLHFPLQYGDRQSAYYYSHGKYSNRLEVDLMGKTEIQADAYGMMILPDKDTLKQVLRTRTIKYIAETARPISTEYYEKLKSPRIIPQDSIEGRLSSDSVLFVVETFRWYEKGYRYPVFETVRSWEQHRTIQDYEFLHTAFFYPPQDHYYLSDDTANLILQEEDSATGSVTDPWEDLTYNIYPNPVRNEALEIEMYLPRPAGIRIELRTTMGKVELKENPGHYPVGICSFRIPVSHLPVGNYILDIWLDDKLINEIILKR